MDELNVKLLIANDIVYYLHHENGEYYIESGIVKDEENLYEEGVEVYDINEKWRQYVGKWFITEIVRNEKTIFKRDV